MGIDSLAARRLQRAQQSVALRSDYSKFRHSVRPVGLGLFLCAGIRIHDLRRTFASGGLLIGEGLAMIGQLLEHTLVQTAAKYAHLTADPIKQAAKKISDRLPLALSGTIDNSIVTKAIEIQSKDVAAA